ncbi:hypothetical protein FGB62_322g019 [Gracilaria domingensis]|nr:hypothetical protein FGB62_322g019 [Gracilaria domingensis]
MIGHHSARPPRPEAPRRAGIPHAPQNAPQWIGKHQTQRFPYSTDFAMVEDPSQLASVVPEYRHARKRARDQAVREERESKRRNLSLRDDRDDTIEPSYPSQDIRIFDADDEKTPLFRRRTLPDSFLNSQVTNRQRIRTSKYFAKANKSPSKRQKVSTTPDLSSRLEQLKFSPARRIERLNRVSRDSHHHRKRPTERFDVVEHASHLPVGLSDNFRETNTPLEDYGQSVSIPVAALEEPKMMSNRIRDPLHGMAGRHVPESPERAPASPARWRVADADSRAHSPVLSARNMGALHRSSTRLESRFPLIEAESESPPILSPAKKQPDQVIGFRSILALEPIAPDDFSAEVQVLEAKMFERPDSDGGRFKVRRKRLLRGTEGSKHKGKAGGDQWFRTTEGMGRASDEEFNKELFSGKDDVKGAILKANSREQLESGKDVALVEAEAQSQDVVDMTLIRMERNPINVARGRSAGRDHVVGN